MARAVRFDHYGERDVLYLAEVDTPVPGDGEVVVQVKAAGINPGESSIRRGYLDAIFPTAFPQHEIVWAVVSTQQPKMEHTTCATLV